MAITYILSGTNSALTGGADFSKKLVTPTETAGTISVPIAANATETSYAFTEPGVPGVNGSNAAFTVEIEVVTAASSVTVRPHLSRVNSTGVAQAGPIQPTQAAQAVSSTGVKTFGWTAPALGTWAAGDRLRIGFVFVSTANAVRTPVIRTGTTNTEVVTAFAPATGTRLVTPARVRVGTLGNARLVTPVRVRISTLGGRQVAPNKAAVSTVGNARTIVSISVGITIPPHAAIGWAEVETPDPPAVLTRTLAPNRVAASTTGSRTSTPVRVAIAALPQRPVPAAATVSAIGSRPITPVRVAISLEHAAISFAELEAPDAPSTTQRAVDAQVAVSTTGTRTLTPIRAVVSVPPAAVASFAEFEVPDAPTSGGSSPRIVAPVRVAISGTTLAQKQHLLLALVWDTGSSLSRSVPAHAVVTTTDTRRTVTARAAIALYAGAVVSFAEVEAPAVGTLSTRTVAPVRAAVGTTGTRTVTPVRAAVSQVFGRTSTPVRGAVQVTNARAVAPVRVAIALPASTQRIVPAFAAVTLPQAARPVADVDPGDWVRDDGATTNLYAAIDEATPSAADWIASPLSPALPESCDIRLGPIADPDATDGIVVRYWYGRSAATGDAIDLTVTLLDDATVIATWTHPAIPYGPTPAAQTLTSGQAAAITHQGYADGLILRFTAVEGA